MARTEVSVTTSKAGAATVSTMGEARARRAIYRSDVCAFCSSKVDSAEHLWSEWMTEIFQEACEHTRIEGIVRIGRRRQRHPLQRVSLTSAVVCQGCNNGWMSRLESPMKSCLQTLLSGIDSLALLRPLPLEPVRQWLYLKALVMDYSSPDPVVSDVQRRSFAASQAVPHDVTIWVCRYDGDPCEWHLLSNSLDINGTSRARIVTFNVGRIAMQSVISPFMVETDSHVAGQLTPSAAFIAPSLAAVTEIDRFHNRFLSRVK
jgi:hypothetical protein